MKKIFILFVSTVLIIFGMSSFSAVSALTCPFGGSPNWQGVCDTTTESGDSYFGPPMKEEEAKVYTENNSKSNVPVSPENNSNSNSNVSVSNISSENSYIIQESNTSQPNSVPEVVISNPDVFHGYAAVDPDGNVLTVIVCNYNVCGKNDDYLNIAIKETVFPLGTRLVFQTLREEGTGNVAGYMNAKFDQQTNSFKIVNENGAVFQIPSGYPGSQELICIKNCDTLTVDETELESSINTNDIQENNIEEVFVPMIFSTKLKSNTLATVIATNKNKTKIWKTKVNKNGKVKININKKYKQWKFRIKIGS